MACGTEGRIAVPLGAGKPGAEADGLRCAIEHAGAASRRGCCQSGCEGTTKWHTGDGHGGERSGMEARAVLAMGEKEAAVRS